MTGSGLVAATKRQQLRDRVYLGIALETAKLSTCVRRDVGCVLTDHKGVVLATGYNGTPRGFPHCKDNPDICPNAFAESGTGLEGCLSSHAEQNALMWCPDVGSVYSAYVTASPCWHCVKMLLNTGCRRIVFADEYPHPMSRDMWVNKGREWICLGTS